MSTPIIHKAGPVVDGVQRCDRCRAVLNHTPKGWEPTSWHVGAEVVNHGHGAWSLVRDLIPPLDGRDCVARRTA